MKPDITKEEAIVPATVTGSICVDFNRNEINILAEIVRNKTIANVVIEEGMNDKLVFHFCDNSKLKIEYDWIYEWELSN